MLTSAHPPAWDLAQADADDSASGLSVGGQLREFGQKQRLWWRALPPTLCIQLLLLAASSRQASVPGWLWLPNVPLGGGQCVSREAFDHMPPN